jgi:hypoxanthine phosphoribosyltransferase
MDIKIKDLTFEPYINEKMIAARVIELANKVTSDFYQKEPLFLSVLNGSFMFLSDFMKSFMAPCEISFIKLESYEGTKSTGKMNELLGLKDNLEGKHIIIVEDIIDTGNTVSYILEKVKDKKPASIKILTLLFKPDSLKHNITIDYVGFEIENKFVVGYGLDYNEHGRNLDQIYVHKSTV